MLSRGNLVPGLVMFWGLTCFAGCGQAEDNPIVQVPGVGVEPKPALTIIPDQTNKTNPAFARLHQPFKDAAILEPPDGENRPPDRTLGGKSVADIYEGIVGKEGVGGLWDSITLVSSDGKPLRSTAQIKTDLGVIEVELLAQAAPNHVRNFIALARTGYFDGLPFHRSIRRESQDKTLAYLEAGCPLGTGESGYGSIGYWLKPEISSSLLHEEGTIGAYHGEELETAACKFYITLGRAPWMDGNYTIFGKITRGLDVAHTINKRPVAQDDVPRDPIIIRAITITQK